MISSRITVLPQFQWIFLMKADVWNHCQWFNCKALEVSTCHRCLTVQKKYIYIYIYNRCLMHQLKPHKLCMKDMIWMTDKETNGRQFILLHLKAPRVSTYYRCLIYSSGILNSGLVHQLNSHKLCNTQIILKPQ